MILIVVPPERIDLLLCVLERREVDTGICAHDGSLAKRDMLDAASAFQVVTSCMLDQNTAHQLG